MRNFKVIMSYCGTNYHGFQRQNNALAVQQVVEETLSRLLGENVVIIGCSRTDTGVHARKFVFNFKTESTIDCRGIVFGANPKLPDDIAFISCEEVDNDFHARYNCKGKEYEYIIHNSQIKSPFYADRAFRSWYPIDADKLNRASQDYVGEHDFKALCSTDCEKENTVRTIYSFSVKREGDLIIFRVHGNGFLYNMVRIMIGTLLFINEGKIAENCIPDIIKSKDRRRAGKTVGPQGLYLDKVFYE